MPPLLNVIGAAIAVVSLFCTPLALVRAAFPSLSAASTAAGAGALSIALSTAVPVLLHIASIPLRPVALSVCHAALLTMAAAALRLRGIRLIPDDISSLRWPALLCFAGALLAAPVTPLAGVDTYKWQDLATVVQVEGRIPWLLHLGGLFGFAPRGYPCAQPLTLASVQMMGNLGVETGYFVVSLLSLSTAVFGAYRLGLALAASDRFAVWLAALYAFAPVAMRYHHWATGRGFFLAVLPLFILGHVGRPRPHLLLAAGSATLLLLAHKTAVVAVPLLAAGMLFAPALSRSWRVPLALASAVVAVIVAGGSFAPSVAGIVSALRLAATRLGVLAPLVALAVFLPDSREDSSGPMSQRRKMLTLLLVLLPIAFTPDMYGALFLLPLAAVAAVHGMSSSSLSLTKSTRLLHPAVAALLALGAVAIVVNRNMDATPRRIREAAVFLDRYDPTGPFRIVAPDRIQGRMQAYVRGCPRFSVFTVPGSTADRARHAIPLDSPRAFVSRFTAYLRKFLDPADLATDWYGGAGTVYHVLVDGKGSAPPGAALVYDKDAVRILRTGGTPDTKSIREPH